MIWSPCLSIGILGFQPSTSSASTSINSRHVRPGSRDNGHARRGAMTTAERSTAERTNNWPYRLQPQPLAIMKGGLPVLVKQPHHAALCCNSSIISKDSKVQDIGIHLHSATKKISEPNWFCWREPSQTFPCKFVFKFMCHCEVTTPLSQITRTTTGHLAWTKGSALTLHPSPKRSKNLCSQSCGLMRRSRIPPVLIWWARLLTRHEKYESI